MTPKLLKLVTLLIHKNMKPIMQQGLPAFETVLITYLSRPFRGHTGNRSDIKRTG
jgi:hypothetical protein